jgi:choline/glycine/proline betaine transport protein
MAKADEEKDVVGAFGEGLQVELFHPESDRKVGDTNVEKWGFDVHPVVFPASSAVIIVVIALTLLFPDQAGALYSEATSIVTGTFGWFLVAAINLFILTLVFFALSKYGSIRIGGVEAEKEFSDFSWAAMLFSAGMGIGLMFFSVAEPMYFFDGVPPYFSGVEAGTSAAAGAALTQTFFHWGLHPWAIYGIVALGLAFFSFNRGLPLTIRSIFWPLLGDRIYGWPGHLIDIIAVFTTMFGLASSLGFGVAQVNTGLAYVAGDLLGIANIPEATWVQILLIAGITGIATASVAAGLEGGVKRLSNINLVLMVSLLVFVLVVGPTSYLINGFLSGVGGYVFNLTGLSLYTGTFSNGDTSSFMTTWTLFYWAWWAAWAPFVGMFIARISKGRTIREFVVGVLVIPSLFSFLWLATFGGSALFAQMNLGGGMLAALNNRGSTIAMFEMFSFYPLTVAASIVATLLVITFFVTSSDSGSLVIDHLTSGGKHDVPKVQRIFWALTEGAVASVLLFAGGLGALRSASISTGLIFYVIMVLMCYTVYLGLAREYKILKSDQFAEQLDELAEREGVEITKSGDTVTSIRTSSDSTVSDD